MTHPIISIPRARLEDLKRNLEQDEKVNGPGLFKPYISMIDELLAAPPMKFVGTPVAWRYKVDGKYELSNMCLNHSYRNSYSEEYVQGEALFTDPTAFLFPAHAPASPPPLPKEPAELDWPFWANFVALGSSGYWVFYELQPTLTPHDWLTTGGTWGSPREGVSDYRWNQLCFSRD